MKAGNAPLDLVAWAGGNRVTLAVVFTDIVGSTQMGLELGDWHKVEVMRAHFARSSALLEQYGGSEVKKLGDSVMAVFRSAGAALDYALALHLDPGVDAVRTRGVRAGIHVGAVYASRDDVNGSEVDYTHRVVEAAKGAEIWVSARACEDIRRGGARHQRDLEWAQHDNVELKGFGTGALWSLVVNAATRPGDEKAVAVPAVHERPAAHERVTKTNGRTVFVARPADDMWPGYIRIVDELRNRGFAVVPDSDIPKEDGAVEFIDQALAGAEVALHLLGGGRGDAPTGEEPIVSLQLARAALRAQASGAGLPGGSEFRRIIWAPKILDDTAASTAGAPSERDPLAVLAGFGEQFPGDKVLGENLIRFVDFLYQYLDKTRPRAVISVAELGAGAKIFIDHDEDDIDFADELAVALQERSVTPLLPAFDGKPSLRTAQNRRAMQECSAIAVCWGKTTEAWVMAETSKLDQWRRAGRREQVIATLLAAPPTHRFKQRRLRIKPPGIDHVVDMTGSDKPSPANLDSWLGSSDESSAGDN
ncbi:MAG: adenylate/guanylate cyclase domain-containing protein [Stellaceae bacterium]